MFQASKRTVRWRSPSLRVVPYKRVYGVDEPAKLVHANNGKLSPHLPEGTPFGLVGTSSLYKRESATFGAVPEGGMTAASKNRPVESGRSRVRALARSRARCLGFVLMMAWGSAA